MTTEGLFVTCALICGAAFLLDKAKMGNPVVSAVGMLSLILTVLLGVAVVLRLLMRMAAW